MHSSICSNKARKNIKENVKRELLQHSGFSCSICGSIPVVFHHIEEWSQKFSNNKEYLIPICDKCHRQIHGEGGSIYSKEELYNFKLNPEKPKLLTYKYELGRKTGYSFFIGSNFISNGEKATLFGFRGFPLTTIDTSSGTLKLSILLSIKNDQPVYLIKDNELIADTKDIWEMKFSGPTLKVFRKIGDKKIILIDLIIKPDVIIIKEMNTDFNGESFRVYKPRVLNKHQIKKLDDLIKEAEDFYLKDSKLIDDQPKIKGIIKGTNINNLIKDLRKDGLKCDIERKLRKIVDEMFKELSYYSRYKALDEALERSSLFRNKKYKNYPAETKKFLKEINKLKKKYKKEFDSLDGIISEYNGMVMSNNIMISID
jgi:hypothetical protein